MPLKYVGTKIDRLMASLENNGNCAGKHELSRKSIHLNPFWDGPNLFKR